MSGNLSVIFDHSMICKAIKNLLLAKHKYLTKSDTRSSSEVIFLIDQSATSLPNLEVIKTEHMPRAVA
jgi:hypothetical protein